jgi:integrase
VQRAMRRPSTLPAEGNEVSRPAHFYTSTLIAANLNPKVTEARLGHASITETMDIYGHLFPDSEDLASMHRRLPQA